MRTTSKYIKAYLALTLVCYILDLISFFVAATDFSNEDEHKSYFGTIYMIFSVLCLMTDIYYIIWSISVYMKLPVELAKPLAKFVGGTGDKMIDVVLRKVAERRG